jgi:hypothetical protein
MNETGFNIYDQESNSSLQGIQKKLYPKKNIFCYEGNEFLENKTRVIGKDSSEFWTRKITHILAWKATS